MGFARLLAQLRPSGPSRQAAGGNGATLHQQHEQIALLLTRARARVVEGAQGLRSGRPVRRSRRGGLAAIAELQVLVVEHFRLEEAHGYLADALALAPELHVRADVLRQQHDGFVKELVGIAELAQRSGRSAEAWAELASRLEAFSAQLREHERAENEISSQAFLQDVGGVD